MRVEHVCGNPLLSREDDHSFSEVSSRQPWMRCRRRLIGRYGVSHLGDHYGYGRQSYADY